MLNMNTDRKAGDEMSISNSSEELALLSSLTAIVLSERLSLKEISVWGNFLVSVGSIMVNIVAQEHASKFLENETPLDSNVLVNPLRKSSQDIAVR